MDTLRAKLIADLTMVAETDPAAITDVALASLGLDPEQSPAGLASQLYRGRYGMAALDEETRQLVTGLLMRLRPDLAVRRIETLTQTLLTEVFDTPTPAPDTQPVRMPVG